VSIRFNSTGTGTTTDINGAFKIDVNNATDTLTFTFIGYQTQKVVVGTSKIFNIKLLPSQENTLKEVQVIGYGTSLRANLATAVSTVKGSVINERPTTTNVLQGLAGKVAGVNIMINSGRPGGSPAIKIRGNGSITTSNDPLYVVDGAAGVDFSSIDPSIIESVTILKDAASAAIYGSRGANGVVLITTKKGKEGAATITFNNTLSFGSLQHEVDLMNATQELEMIKRQYAFVNQLAPNLDPNNNFARKTDLFNTDGTPKYNTDWQKEATHTAVSDNHSLSFSGGKDGLTVLANVAFRNQQGIIKSTYSKQLTGFISLGWDVKPWMHIDAQLNSGAQQGNNEYSNVFGFTPLRELYEFASFLPVNYPDGTPSLKGDFPNLEQSENPVTLENGIKTIAGKTFSQANFTGTIHLSHKLDFVTKFTGSTENDYTDYYENNNLFPDASTLGGDAKRGNTLIGSWTNENYFSYKNDFGKHHIELIGGASWYYTATTYTNAESTGFFDNFYSFNNLSVGAVTLPTLSGYTLKTLNSYYGRANYNYDNRFLFGASLRSDGASNFGLNKKYGVFPSFSAGWNISNEQFFQGISKTISLLKIRGSYGIVGNEELNPYISLAQLVNGKTVFNNTTVTDVTLSCTAPNPELHWEQAKQLDLGLVLGLFHDRIQFTADYYNKVNSSLLYLQTLAPSSGFTNINYNIGDISNRGIEL
jgi:TonB-linked SusC/RagA family outer membrane protein